MSVTKHVLMLWLVAGVAVPGRHASTVRRYLRQDRLVPSGFMNALEFVVEFVRDSIVQPNVGSKWVNTWTPLLLTLFLFILAANVIGLIPIFDVLALLNHTVLHLPEDVVLHAGHARRRHRDRQLQRHGGAGHHHVLRHHRRRRRARTASSSTGRTWCRTACRCR